MGRNSRLLILGGMLAIAVIVASGSVRRYQDSANQGLDFTREHYWQIREQECPGDSAATIPSGQPGAIAMLDASGLLGEAISTKTFGLSVADVNGDGKDDILIGAHEHNPYLFMNSGDGFTNESRVLFHNDEIIDRHGYTFADLDNDGDLDLAIAGGGGDGVGKGAPNLFLRNVSENGVLRFSGERVSDAMMASPSRTRAVIPVASPDGKAIDLYFTALAREGFPNRLFRNGLAQDDFRFEPEDGFLTLSVNDHGRGVVADFDADGNSDYLVVEDSLLNLYWHPDSGRGLSRFSFNAFSTSVADFNNDGRLDIFVGTKSPGSKSDNLTFDSGEIIFALHRNKPDDTSSITFKSQSPVLKFNLNQLIRATDARPVAGAGDIFLGSRKTHPGSRKFTLRRRDAKGAPESFDKPGIYIWYSPSSREWNMKWRFHDDLDEFKGIVEGEGISDVARTNFTANQPVLAEDAIFINRGNGEFSRLCAPLVPHRETTSDSTVADFNNDGWLDIIGLRHGEEGSTNRDLFVLTNHAGMSFSSSSLPLRDIDRMRRSDLIAHGFFDGDDRPDIVLTNGFGQIPGNNGSPRLMLNNTPADAGALLVGLQGVGANHFGIGAKLTLTDASNTVIGFRIQGLNSNLTQDSAWMHFGLGRFPPPFSLKVDWPDGSTTTHAFSAPGRYTLKQEAGE